MEITDEVRRAVLAGECQRSGHVMDISEAFSNDPNIPGDATTNVRAHTPGKLPHLFCQRCGCVWLVLDAGHDYDDAVDRLKTRLKDPNSVRPREPEHTH